MIDTFREFLSFILSFPSPQMRQSVRSAEGAATKSPVGAGSASIFSTAAFGNNGLAATIHYPDKAH